MYTQLKLLMFCLSVNTNVIAAIYVLFWNIYTVSQSEVDWVPVFVVCLVSEPVRVSYNNWESARRPVYHHVLISPITCTSINNAISAREHSVAKMQHPALQTNIHGCFIVTGDINLPLNHCCAVLHIFRYLTMTYRSVTQSALFLLHCNNDLTRHAI
jgi:hypothetical protein